jgi:hypothetical protein
MLPKVLDWWTWAAALAHWSSGRRSAVQKPTASMSPSPCSTTARLVPTLLGWPPTGTARDSSTIATVAPERM